MSAPQSRDADQPKLGIVVVNFGSHTLLERNLVKVAPTVASTVVVDSFTTADERVAVSELASANGWTLVGTDRNVGFGVGMNLGVTRSLELGCTHALLLNPDVAVSRPELEALLRAADEHPRALVTPRLERPDGSIWFAGGQLDLARGLTRSRPDEQQVGPERWLTAACLLVERGIWERLGGFDPRYFLYWEDIDLSQRWLRLGGDLRVVHEVCVVHDVGGTQRGRRKSGVYGRKNCENRLRFASIHLPPATRVRWLLNAPLYAFRVSMRDGRRAALRNPRLVAGAVWGTFVGVGLVIASLVRGVLGRST